MPRSPRLQSLQIDNDDDDDDAGHALKKRSSKRAATEPAGPKCAKKGQELPSPPQPRAGAAPAPKASPKRAPKAKKSPSSAPKAKPTVRKAVAQKQKPLALTGPLA